MGSTRARGDQLVTIVVQTPKSLTDEQRELLTRLAETFDSAANNGSKRDGWFDKLKQTLGSDE